jgi:hypothetical protein
VREHSHSGARRRRGARALVLSAAGALALLAGAEIDAVQAALPQQAGRADLGSDVHLRIDGAIGGGRTGAAVAGAGDVNGDGRGDVVVGAPQETARGRSGSGSAYVIFGTGSPTTVDLAQVGARGFRIDGAADGDRLGTAVGGAGDVNGDGLADVVLGAPEADANGRGGSGTAFVVFGRREASGAVDLAALGGAGFRIDGAAALDNAGAAVAGAGDVNGDGRADVVVGAPRAGNNSRPGSGSVAVVFGTGQAAAVDLATLGGAGFRIDGAAALDNAGAAVAGAGDVNGDGRADLVMGAPQAGNNSRPGSGSADVVFGRRETSEIDLAALAGAGFRIDGAAALDNAGAAVAGPGDVNGDGRADVVVGAPQSGNNSRTGSGSAHVVFGTGQAAAVDLAALGGAGFRIDGAAALDNAGAAVAGAGDVNGDGRADVVVGAPQAGSNGRTGSGSAHVVFGRRETSGIDLAALAGAGFRIDGAAALDNAGAAVAGAGDVNGDGRADVVVGAPQAGNNARPGSGSAHVLIGFGTPRVAYRELVAAAGVPMTPLAPTVERTGPATFAVSPALPEGLSLDPATGVISGTPTTARPRRAHTVTMTDLAGTAQNALVITVTRPAGRRSGVCGVVPRRERPAFAPGTVTLSARQLRINQRIAQAAVRRVNAVQAWLDARVDGGDICGLSLTAAKFGPGVVTGPGPTAPASDAFPRPFREKKPPKSQGARVVLSARQLQVSQRISQAAMRRAKALSRRLGRGLTGGDIRRGTITRDVLAPGLAIIAATPLAHPPRPSRTVIPAPRARKPGRFELSPAQLLTNQRIAQAALRRATVLRDELRAGLTAEDFRDRTITAVNLAPALIPQAGARPAAP